MSQQIRLILYLLFTFPLLLKAQVDNYIANYATGIGLSRIEYSVRIANNSSYIVDTVFDKDKNVYELSIQNVPDKSMIVLQKKSDDLTLLWEYSIEYLDGSILEPESITLYDNQNISILYNKQKQCEAREFSMVFINTEGEFLNHLLVE